MQYVDNEVLHVPRFITAKLLMQIFEYLFAAGVSKLDKIIEMLARTCGIAPIKQYKYLITVFNKLLS